MGRLKVSSLWIAAAFIAACSAGKAPGVAAPGEGAPAAAAPPQKTVFDPSTQQLERAREVQATVDQNADDTRKAVDSQERGDSSP